MSTATTEVTAFKAMQTDLQISMDDVVSAFVSEYENNLYQRKAELTKSIRAEESKLEDLEKEVLATVTGEEYEQKLPLDLLLEVHQGTANYKDKKVGFTITIVPNKASKGYYGNQIKIEKSKPIPAKFIKQHDKIVDELDNLRRDLSEVLVNLKSVTRKERQVRGRIAMRKLEDSGYQSLMQDQELLKLVQLEEGE